MNLTVDVHTAHVQLTNLYKYTLYDIYVTVRTRWDGQKSETITVSTDEGSMLYSFYLWTLYCKGCRIRTRQMVSVPDSGSSGPGSSEISYPDPTCVLEMFHLPSRRQAAHGISVTYTFKKFKSKSLF